MPDALSETPPLFCRPNIGNAGRHRRTIVGVGIIAAAIVYLVFLIAMHLPWVARLSLFLPVAGAAVTLLQVRRRT